MGHVARVAEEAGIATVIIATDAFRERLEAMKVPRLLSTPFWMGRPLGRAGDSATQRRTLLSALELLATE
ncbi:MAG: hypothetical protein KJZ86_24655 [Caldilineaceae bacterium]|nr:hypothetical protein [Caldilineaceae bacterium]HRJ41886.1 hypothetical protein [Caldilineaceae bacterium]